MDSAKNAIEAAKAKSDLKAEAAASVDLASLLEADYQPEQSLTYATNAQTIFAQLGDKEGEIKASKVIVDALLKTGQRKKAIDKATAALALAEKTGNKSEIAGAYCMLANASEPEDAAGVMKKAVAKYKETNDNTALATSVGLLAKAYLKNGHFKNALLHAKESISKLREAGASSSVMAPSYVVAVDALVGIANLEGQYETALGLCQDALALAHEGGSEVPPGPALTATVNTLIALGMIDEAVKSAEQEMAALQNSGNQLGQASVVFAMVTAYMAAGDTSAAMGVGAGTMPLFDEAGDKAGKAAVQVSIAEMHLIGGNAQVAQAEAQKALLVLEQDPSSPALTKCKAVLSYAYCHMGTPQMAPNRPRALELTAQLKTAMIHSDQEAYTGLMNEVNLLGGVMQEDFDKVITEAMSTDPKATSLFLKSLPSESQPGDAVEKARQLTYEYLYLQFRVTGLGYGPRFRAQHPYGTKTGKWGTWYAMGVNDMQDDCEDWEHAMITHPGIIDSALHVGVAASVRPNQ